MARTLEMIFDAKVRNAADVAKLEATIANVAKTTNMSAVNLRQFNEVLNVAVRYTGSYSEALKNMSASDELFSAASRQVLGALNEQNKSADAAAKAAARAASDFEAAKKREAAAAKKAADEIIAQHERVQKTLGRVGARIGGSVAGIPGGGFAASSLLGGLGLSGGASLAVGGVAAGIFAGVEFARSLDQLAKWAQEQRNAAAETGVTVSEMQELSRVSERTGVSLTGAAKSVQDLSKEMVAGGGRAREIQSALSELGLKSSVAFEEPYKGLTDIQKGLSAIKDPVERDRVAIELLGEAAGRAAVATAGIGKSGNIIDPGTVATLNQAREQMELIGEKWDLLKSKFANPLLATLKVVTAVEDSIQHGGWWNSDPRMAMFGASAGKWPAPAPRGVGSYPFDLGAEDSAARNSHALAWMTAHGTAEDRYRSTDEGIETDQKRIRDQYQGGKLTNDQFDSQMAAIEARKAAASSARKSAEEYRSQVERFQTFSTEQGAAPTDAAEIARQLKEFPRSYSRLGAYGPYQNYLGQLGANANSGFLDYSAGMFMGRGPLFDRYNLETHPERDSLGDVQSWLKDRQRDEEEKQRAQEQARKDQRQRLDDISARSRDTTEDTEAALRLQTALSSGARGALSRSGALSSTGIAQLSLEDQLRLIQQSYAGKSGPITGAISQQTGELGLAATPDDKQAIQRQIDNERAELQKLQNDRLTQSVDALNKFNESVDEASNKLKDEFGNFAEGLFSAGLKGHAGSYARSFFIGQGEKAVGNLAKSAYIPGMLSLPGQGTASDPTFLGRMLQGTMFAQDPKAQGNVATTDNTSATIDNTKATLALCSALGIDPSTLGISGSSAVSVPSLGSLGAASGGLLGQVQSVAKTLGISLPGIPSTRSGANSRSIASGNPAIASILKLFGLGSGPSGDDMATAAYLTDSGGGGGSDSDFPDAFTMGGGSDNSFPATIDPTAWFSGGDFLSGSGANSQANSAFTDSVSDSIGSAFSSDSVTNSVGSAFAKAVAGETTSTSGGLTTAQSRSVSAALSGAYKGIGGGFGSANPTALGMGVQAAGGAFGVYSGITEATHGGAQNITGGIGTALLSAAAFTGPAAPFVAAAGAVMSLVSAFMGDPRANRAKQLTEEQIAQTYTAPNPLNITTNANGMMTTTDYRGNVESLDARPSVQSVQAILGFDPYSPSHLISSSQWQLTPSGMVPPSSKTTPASTAPIQITQHISAMDSKSIMDRGPDIADSLVPVLQGTHRISNEIQRVVSPS